MAPGAWACLEQVAMLLALLGCLTLSLIGGNESGKPLPDTYTYEQFVEYQKKHGAEATKKKMREIEQQRAVKAKQQQHHLSQQQQQRKSSRVQQSPSARQPSPSAARLGTAKANVSQRKVSGNKTPLTSPAPPNTASPPPTLVSPGGTSRKESQKQGKTKGSATQLSVRQRRRKSNREFKDREERRSLKASDRDSDQPKTDAPEETTAPRTSRRGIRDSKRQSDGRTAAAPANSNTNTNTSTMRAGYTLPNGGGGGTFSSEPVSRRSARASERNVSVNRTANAVSTRERRPIHEGALKPVVAPMPLAPAVVPRPEVPKMAEASSAKNEEENTPTVFELVNAPLRPVKDKYLTKKNSGFRKSLHRLEQGTTVDDKPRETPVKKEQEGEDQKELARVKAELKRKHQRMSKRQKRKHPKRKKKEILQSGSSRNNGSLTPTKKLQAIAGSSKHTRSIRKTRSVRRKRKSKAAKLAQDGADVAKAPVSESVAAHTAVGGVFEQTPTPKDVVSNDTGTNRSSRSAPEDRSPQEHTAEGTEEDEDAPIMPEYRPQDMRKVQSERTYKERPTGKLKMIVSERICGHPHIIARRAIAEMTTIVDSKAKANGKSAAGGEQRPTMSTAEPIDAAKAV